MLAERFLRGAEISRDYQTGRAAIGQARERHARTTLTHLLGRKPNGQFVFAPKMGPAFVQDLPSANSIGVGPATSAKMNGRLVIFTDLDMRYHTLEFVNANFGKACT